MVTVIKDKTPIEVSPAIQRQAGLAPGDKVEIKAIGGVITIVGKPGSAMGEYSPDQRKAIDKGLAEAENGPFHGPFKDGVEVAAYLKRFKRRGARTGKTRKLR
jgi:hypothetical protein